LMALGSASAPSGSAVAASGQAALSVSLTKRAEMEAGWLMIYLCHQA
jgi:hypothetical protein